MEGSRYKAHTMMLSVIAMALLIAGADSISCKTCDQITTTIDGTASTTGTVCNAESAGTCADTDDNVCVTETYSMKITKEGKEGTQVTKQGLCGKASDYANIEAMQTSLCTSMNTQLTTANTDFSDLVCKVATCNSDNCNSGFIARISSYLLSAVLAFSLFVLV